MQKEFIQWNKRKMVIHEMDGLALFHEREVWWCTLGVNIGSEQDGGHGDFGRPVVIIKKFNLDSCIVVPLTTKNKNGKYYFSVGKIEEREAVAVLSQVRFIDRRRLSNKICTLERKLYRNLLNKIVEINFESPP
jgi:mRNA interferase MazF